MGSEAGEGTGAARTSWPLILGSFLIPVAHAAGQNAVTVLGLRFLTDNLGLAASAAGMIFALVRVYDALFDPAVGAWSDTIRSRWGRRLPFLLAGGIAMPLGLAMLFGAPGLGSVLALQLWVTAALMLHASGYSLLTIPGFAIAVESSPDPDVRTRIIAWRTYGNAVGTLLGSTLPAWILAAAGAGRTGHLAMALTVGAVVLAATLGAIALLQGAPRTMPQPRAGSYALWRQAKLAWGNRPFRILVIAHVFLLVGATTGSAAMAFFSRHVLKAGDGVLGSYFMVSTIAVVATMPGWVWVSRRTGKKACYVAAMGLFGLVHLSWLLAGSGEPELLILGRAALGGAGGGGMILFAYALLSDAVRWDFVTSGQRREGAFAGFTTLFDKLSGAVALAGMGAFLSANGYGASAGGSAAPQSAQALLAITACVSILPALSMAAAMLAVRAYDLDPARLAEVEAEAEAGALALVQTEELPA